MDQSISISGRQTLSQRHDGPCQGISLPLPVMIIYQITSNNTRRLLVKSPFYAFEGYSLFEY